METVTPSAVERAIELAVKVFVKELETVITAKISESLFNEQFRTEVAKAADKAVDEAMTFQMDSKHLVTEMNFNDHLESADHILERMIERGIDDADISSLVEDAVSNFDLEREVDTLVEQKLNDELEDHVRTVIAKMVFKTTVDA